jgi:hypothetical protein
MINTHELLKIWEVQIHINSLVHLSGIPVLLIINSRNSIGITRLRNAVTKMYKGRYRMFP